jgi:hypothetical protein
MHESWTTLDEVHWSWTTSDLETRRMDDESSWNKIVQIGRM